MGTAGVLRIVAASALAFALWIYYSHGLSIQIWPDSFSYLTQAQGIAGLAPYARPSDRNAGYPALVALALLTPRPAFTLVLLQALIAIGGLFAVHRTLTRGVLPRCGIAPARHQAWKLSIQAATALAGLYSGLHVHVAAVLTETLFAGAALLAVLATIWLVRPDRVSRWPWVEAPVVAAIGAVPLLVKPHWLLAAAGLAMLSGVWLWRATVRPAAPVVAKLLQLVLALGLAAGAAFLTILPDRLLAQRYSPRDHALFGPRTAFCNHAHLIMATLARRPSLALQDDPVFERRLRSQVDALVASHTKGWRLLGFNGDLCAYSSAFSALIDERYPDARDGGRFLIGALARAALSDPLPYMRMVLVQSAHGFLSAFDRFAIRTRTGIDTREKGSITNYPPPEFFTSVRDAEEVGPLGSSVAMKETTLGRTVQIVLAVIFFTAGLALIASVLAAFVLPWWRWRRWSPDERQVFLVFIALPLGVLLAHHLLIALIHTFDVWRYGFNMYFVNLLFMGASALFWLGNWQRSRPSDR
jgi:hypothetical protein